MNKKGDGFSVAFLSLERGHLCPPCVRGLAKNVRAFRLDEFKAIKQ